MGKVFLMDVDKCNGCYSCQVVCKDEHCGNDWRPYAAPQPETGHFWMHMVEKTRGQVPTVRVAYTAVMCAHCEDAPCAEACTSGAFTRREDGLLLIDPDTCTGCGACVDACPLHAIYFNEEAGIAQKCTGCAHLLDNEWTEPRCVDACSHEALIYREESEIADLLADAVALEPVAGFGPRVFYRNLPKRWIAGCLVDFEEDEVVIGAEVTIAGPNGFTATQPTDEFGDFWFKQIEPGEYTVTAAKDGYAPFEMTVDVTAIDRTLGDLAFKKA